MVEDPRAAREDICGAIVQGDKYEWICIKKPHDKVYRRKTGLDVFASSGAATQHYFINRYPNQGKDE